MIANIQQSVYGVARYAGQRMSKEDFLRWESDDNYDYEFSDGVLQLKKGGAWDEYPETSVDSCQLAPGFMVHVVSDRASTGTVRRKIYDDFANGVQMSWLVFPSLRTVHVYTSPITLSVYMGDDVLPTTLVLPNFQLTVAELFMR